VGALEQRRLGPFDVSVVGLGCNNFGGRLNLERTRAVVDAALDAGVNFFDTADVYGNRGGSERFLGELLEGRRDRVVLATKFGNDMGDGERAGGSREYLRRAVDASLGRLRTDRIELLYYHRPDGVTPVSETIGAMAELVDEGKVVALGVSNFDVGQLEEAVEAGEIAALQNEYSLLERDAERDVVPRCRELGVGFVPYFPLASGLLTGKYRRGEPAPEGSRLAGRSHVLTDEKFDEVEAFEEFARERGRSLLELAIGALAAQPGVASVIAGATTPEQVRANVAAAAWTPTAEDLDALQRFESGSRA
jgi:aryl-alcohol dehydrogenase-like predicted oxidoreductase